MTVSWIEKANGYAAGGTAAVDVTQPPSLAVGDLMVAHMASNNGGAVTWSTTESGWAELADSGNQALYWLYIPTAAVLAAQDGTYRFTCSNAIAAKGGHVSVFRGVPVGSQIDVVALSAVLGADPTCPTVTTSGKNRYIFNSLWSSTAASGASVGSSGATERFDVSPGASARIVGGDLVIAASGATGTFPWTEDSGASLWSCATIAIIQAAEHTSPGGIYMPNSDKELSVGAVIG